MAVDRVGVSFEPELLSKFDAMIRRKGYTNRSEAIRDIVRKALLTEEIEVGAEDVVGTLTIVYEHDAGDITNRLLDIQHGHHSEIISTIHIHMERHLCLEVLVIRGRVKSVIELADGIKALKGVKHGELVITKSSF